LAVEPKVIHVRDQNRYELMGHDVKLIDRTTPYGNEFRIGVDGDRAMVIELFRRGLIADLLGRHAEREWDRIRRLRGKTLACHCAPLPCHGDVWLEFAAMTDGQLEAFLDRERRAMIK
jgi:uncharacterized protein DUF4326